jgi:hypothetical protein
MARSVLILGVPGVQSLDLVGPSEVFTYSTLCLQGMGRADDGYDVRVVSRNSSDHHHHPTPLRQLICLRNPWKLDVRRIGTEPPGGSGDLLV